MSPRKGKDRDGVGKGTDASYHRRNTTPDTVLDPPRASAGLEDAPEDPIVEAAEESEEEDEGYQGSEALADVSFRHLRDRGRAGTGSNHPWARACGRAGTQGGRSVPPLLLGDRGSGWRNKYPLRTSCRRSSPGADPTVIFGVATEEANRTTGLEPWTGKLCVRFGGVQNNGVKVAMKTAGFRVASSTKGEKSRSTSTSPGTVV